MSENFTPDLNQPDDFAVGDDSYENEVDDQPEVEEVKEEVKEEKEDVVSSIAEDLSETTQEVQEEVTSEANVAPIDFTKLSKADIQRLKDLLNDTPNSTLRKQKGNAKITLRQIDDKLIIDFKRAFTGLVENFETGGKKEVLLIPVKYYGEKDFVNIHYSEFMKENNRVVCEVIASNRKVDQKVVGETISAETGKLTDMIEVFYEDEFAVKLPNGATVVLPARIVNA